MEKVSDEILIEKTLEGDIKAFEKLINRYRNKGYGLLLNMLKNKMDAEEVLQDAFLKVYKNLKTFRGNSKFSTWFYKIVYNSGLSFLKTKRRKEENITDSLEGNHDGVIFPDFSILNDNKWLNRVVEQLPFKNALVINLFYIDELSIKEISEITGYSQENVKVLLYRSRKALREIILKNNYLEEIK